MDTVWADGVPGPKAEIWIKPNDGVYTPSDGISMHFLVCIVLEAKDKKRAVLVSTYSVFIISLKIELKCFPSIAFLEN